MPKNPKGTTFVGQTMTGRFSAQHPNPDFNNGPRASPGFVDPKSPLVNADLRKVEERIMAHGLGLDTPGKLSEF